MLTGERGKCRILGDEVVCTTTNSRRSGRLCIVRVTVSSTVKHVSRLARLTMGFGSGESGCSTTVNRYGRRLHILERGGRGVLRRLGRGRGTEGRVRHVRGRLARSVIIVPRFGSNFVHQVIASVQIARSGGLRVYVGNNCRVVTSFPYSGGTTWGVDFLRFFLTGEPFLYCGCVEGEGPNPGPMGSGILSQFRFRYQSRDEDPSS